MMIDVDLQRFGILQKTEGDKIVINKGPVRFVEVHAVENKAELPIKIIGIAFLVNADD